MELDVPRHRKMMAFLQQAKPRMMVRHFGKHHMIQEADRNRRPQRQVVFSFVKLSRMLSSHENVSSASLTFG
jgi:ribosomal protein L18